MNYFPLEPPSINFALFHYFPFFAREIGVRYVELESSTVACFYFGLVPLRIKLESEHVRFLIYDLTLAFVIVQQH